ncbi:signal peptide peptidase SppA [Candidatus Nanohalovita haloferacivicina]|uniref:signal peptide peptidase SppA n=1 Tax=Candidatus Nanohalovita haloferacivicina TaxID=2978046 RepID=UPI00325F9C1D|nr:Protease IV [Candidatus Nanohalobia archaeon BNXNv]
MNKKIPVLLTALILISTGMAAAFSLDSLFQTTGTAAVIQLSGSITPTSSGFSSGITPEKVRDLNQRAQQQNVDAIVYEINSGGGSVVASKELMREIESVDVPTVCRFRDVGASGAYMAALGCDRIVADSASLTGSIGVRSSYLQYTGLMDKLGLKYVNISSGEYKELGSPYQNISETQKEMLQAKADKIHEEFYSKVEEERNLSEEQLQEVKTGEPFLGSRAEELGLVDEIGGRQTAYDTAEELAGMELNFRKVEAPSGFNFFQLMGASIAETVLGSESSAFKSEIG